MSDLTPVRKKSARVIGVLAATVLTPALVALGVWLWADRQYMVVSVAIAFVALVPFFVAFERGDNTVRELVVVATLTALSVVGRLIFAPLPGFKPVAAVVIVTGACFGWQAGFVTGAMSALVSNIFYGQGPWTPFQMFAWGICGFLSGLLFFRRNLGKATLPLVLACGAFCGVLYSMIMDIWTTLSFTGEFGLSAYFAAVTASLPFTLEYALSNVLFLLVLYKPFARRMNRMRVKYGVFAESV